MKVCARCGVEIFTRDVENRCETCKSHPFRKARMSRKERDEFMRSLGLERAKGAMGGTYYE